MNEMVQFISRWLTDYYLLATVLLAGVIVVGKLVRQPARRIAISWSAAIGLVGLALLCAMPGWSWLHLIGPSSVLPEQTTLPQPLKGFDDQITQLPPMLELPELSNATKLAVEGAATYEPITPLAINYRMIVLSVIFSGAAVLTAWLVLGIWQVRRLRLRAIRAPNELIATVEKLLPTGAQVPPLGVVAQLRVAAAVGLWRPMVLLSQKMVERASTKEIQTVLAHELAHLRHRDLWLLALLRGLLLVLWAHPLYWWWRRCVRLDQETLADTAAAEVTSRTDYAEQLVVWARTATGARTPRFASSVGLWESPSQLRRRVAVLLDERMTILLCCSRRWQVGSLLSLWTVVTCLSGVTLTPSDVLRAEGKPENKTETESTLASGSMNGTLRSSSPVADSIEGKSDTQYDVFSVSPAVDEGPTDRSVADKETPAGTVSLSDEEKGKLMRLHARRIYAAKKPNAISGICIDEKGQPLPGVLVEVYSRRISGAKQSAKPILTARSDQRGEFRFEDVVNIGQEFPEGIPAENFQPSNGKFLTFIGRVDGRVPGFGANRATSIARHGEIGVWVMQRAQTLRGRVTDEQRQPVVGAQVTAGIVGMLGGIQGSNSAKTSANGEYAIADLAALGSVADPSKTGMPRPVRAGPVPLIVKHPKFATKRVTIKQIPGTVDVQLLPGSVIKGKVVFPEDDTNEKFPIGSTVRLQRVLPQPKLGQRPGLYQFQTESTRLDRSGHYQFASLPAGKYHLTADVEGWVTQGIENVEVARGETVTGPDILLTRGGRVRVQLLDNKTGQPMRFEIPTKGYINPQQRPQRAPVFMSQSTIVEFSTGGIGEIQLPAGNYAFLVSIPIEDGDLISGAHTDFDQWPTYEVVDGKQLDLSVRMRIQKRSLSDGAWTVTGSASSPSDESVEEETTGNSFVPATTPAEEFQPGK